MTAWYEDDQFWATMMPMMFTERRMRAAVMEVGLLIGLLRLAPGMAVLDLGCGIGRHTLELARRGYAAVGVDRTALYLERARERAAAASLDVELVQADMRAFARDEAFDAVISLYSSFGYFESIEENRQVLVNAHRSLKPGGAVLLDMISKETLAPGFRARDWEEENGVLFLQERKLIGDWDGLTCRWILVRDGEKLEVTFRAPLFSASELRTLLDGVGFREVTFYGDLGGMPYDHTARRMIAVARK